MKLSVGVLIGAALVALSACSGYPDAQYPLAQGWHVAHLDRQVLPEEPLPLVDVDMDCRSRAAVAGHGEWALVHFRRPPEEVYSVVPAQSLSGLQRGDAVYADVGHCAQALMPRRRLTPDEEASPR